MTVRRSDVRMIRVCPNSLVCTDDATSSLTAVKEIVHLQLDPFAV